MTCITRVTRRPAISIALVLSLSVSALPAAAQQPSTVDGPIARSIEREAWRFATIEQQQSNDVAWSHVRTLSPGTEIIVISNAGPAVTRHFAAATESVLTVLNVNLAGLPTSVRNLLRAVASTHPEYFQAAQHKQSFVLDKHVRLGPDGVFVADQKVADLGLIIETVARTDVVEIKPAKPDVSAAEATVRVLGAIGGLTAGFFVGALGTYALTNSDPSNGAAFFAGIGAVFGGMVGYRAAKRYKSNHVIYSASS